VSDHIGDQWQEAGDQLPAIQALGKRPAGYAPVGPAPSEDEQWHYVADHLAAIRRHLAWIAAVLVISFICGVVAAFIILSDSGSSSGY
jgi:hypothetical protein